MMIRIALGPLWTRVLAFVCLAVVWAALFTASQWVQDRSFPPTVIPILVLSIGAAAVWSAIAVSQVKQRFGKILDDVDLPATRTQALRAAFHGPIPNDPVVRRVAATIAAIRVHNLERQERRQTIANGILAIVTAGMTINYLHDGATRPALMWGLLTLVSGVSAVSSPSTRRRAAHRLNLLADHRALS
jgi:hypothetical protein